MLRPLLAFLVLSFLLHSSAYIITTKPFQANHPPPGDTLVYDITVQEGDPVLVDILLFNGSLGNTTSIVGDGDLRVQSDRSAGFEIPFVPPGMNYTIRLVETSTKKFLEDSPAFQIFAVSSSDVLISLLRSPVSHLTTLPSTTPTLSPPENPSGAGPSPRRGESSGPIKLRHIVGGVIGGVLTIVATITIILCRRRSSKKSSTNETEILLPKADPAFVLHYSPVPGVETPGLSSGPGDPSSLSSGNSNPAGPLPDKFTHGYPVQMEFVTLGVSSSPPSSSDTAAVRAEFLRQTRERIMREIASLETPYASLALTRGDVVPLPPSLPLYQRRLRSPPT